ncbi:hypothetical protein ABPG77_008034 [Micractinium sp. CCAP 211/92]
MSTSAGGGGPGPGPGGTFRSLQIPVKQGVVAMTTAAGIGLIYLFWDYRIRAARKLGHTPKTLYDPEWRQAEEARLRHAPFEANPSKFAYLNPLRHDIPPSKAIYYE